MFTEVYYDPDNIDDADGEWIRLYNPTPVQVNLTGWTITDNSRKWTFPSSIINPESNLTIVRNSTTFPQICSCQHDISGFTLGLNNNNTGDYLFLNNSVGENIDFVAWAGGDDSYPYWSTMVPSGNRISRIALIDTDTAADWVENITAC
jgi:hypothetical protein